MQEVWENEATDILSKLKFIAKFKSSSKVDVGTLRLCSDNWKTSIWRTLISYVVRDESRDVTLEFVRTTVGSALAFLYKNYTTNNEYLISICNIMIDSLTEAKNGFFQLADVSSYRVDPMFTSRVETEKDMLENKIEDLRRKINVARIPGQTPISEIITTEDEEDDTHE
jgi:hypothetical protein